MSKIVITGFMGSGISSVARALAELLGCEMTDLDEAIAAAKVAQLARSLLQMVSRDFGNWNIRR